MESKTVTTLGQAVKKVMRARYQIEKETKGTIRYQQVDGDGEPMDYENPAMVSQTIYIRKTAFKGGQPPSHITVEFISE